MSDALPTCQTRVSSSNFPCQTEPEIRDSYCQEQSIASPESVLQYGAQGSGCGGAALNLVAWLERARLERARLENLSLRLARFKPQIVVSPSAGASDLAPRNLKAERLEGCRTSERKPLTFLSESSTLNLPFEE